MKNTNALRLLGAAMMLSVSVAAVSAQTTPGTPSTPPADKPAATQPQTTPAQPSPSTAPQKPSSTAAAPSDAKQMIGRNALSSDGNKVGDVRAVKTAPDGRVTAIQLKVGGFLGFGGRMVEIPEDKFMQKGEVLQIDYTLDEVDKLPDAKDNS